jgi:hypothetical protein
MSRKRIAVLIFLTSLPFAFAQTAPTSAVPAARLAHIRQGVNLSGWFAQVYDPKGYTKEHLQAWTTASDIALIRSAGFDHVRLSVNPQPFMDAARHRDGGAELFVLLDTAIKMILDAGLAVEIDMHPDSDFKARLAKEDEFVGRFSDFWSTVAKRYAPLDADRVFFEILNEPEMRDAYRWYGVEAKLAAAIRRGAPSNTIIAAGARWDDDDDLHPSGRDVGGLLLALAKRPALSVIARECGASRNVASRGARSHAGHPLRTGSLGRLAHRSRNQSGCRLGQTARRAAHLQ